MRARGRPRSSGADGRSSLELIAALYKSAFTDATVKAGEIGPATRSTRPCTGIAGLGTRIRRGRSA